MKRHVRAAALFAAITSCTGAPSADISSHGDERRLPTGAYLDPAGRSTDIGDLPLDPESLITMIGLDAAEVEIITDGGSTPTEAVRAWVKELQLGSWFNLDHSGSLTQVQFAWCSDRKQLHLFAAADGRSFLIQARRLAAYLQAGLLLPAEEESLTVRATREALAKIDANPERLLG